MQGLLEVMVCSEQSKGQYAEVATVLSVCIRASLESAFQWHNNHTAKEATSEAQRITLLAKACINLLGIELSTFSPVLAPHLPIASEVAAKRLHESFGMELLPWLTTGMTALANYSSDPKT